MISLRLSDDASRYQVATIELEKLTEIYMRISGDSRANTLFTNLFSSNNVVWVGDKLTEFSYEFKLPVNYDVIGLVSTLFLTSKVKVLQEREETFLLGYYPTGTEFQAMSIPCSVTKFIRTVKTVNASR